MGLRNLLVKALERVGRSQLPFVGKHVHPDTLRTVPSWGLSVLLHAFMLLLLAILIRTTGGLTPERSFVGEIGIPEIADLTSLVEADRSGDPFTNLDSPNPPSLGLEPADPLMQLSAQPKIANLVEYAPDLAGPEPLKNLGLDVKGTVALPGLGDQITAPFSGRQGLGRSQLVRREGGTVHSEKAVEEGLSWIVRHQKPDGSWVLDVNEVCQSCPPHRGIDSQTGATGLALLPLLGAGYIHTVKSRHQDSVRRGLEWLCAHQQESGDLHVGGTGISYLYSHAIATMALCEAYGLSRDPKLEEPARRAIAFIVASQDPDTGGWRYVPGQAGDTSVFGWHIFALRSGHMAGLTIPRSTLRGCNDFLNLVAADGKKTTYAYQTGRPATAVMTAEALVARQLLGWPRDHPSLVKGVGRVSAHLEKSDERNIYYWYYATQLLHNMKDKDWDRWNPRVREELIKSQVASDSCAGGSWDPEHPVPDRWGMTAGRLFQTSLSILSLEVYYRYLPLYRTADAEPLEDAPKVGDPQKKK
jgi:Squalene-hopene cyclase C-terminal domain/Prenyltransferase and squalene oxidase repeat